MTFRTAVLGVGMVWLAAVAVQPEVDAQGKTVWDGVYTEELAKRGQASYEAECSSCHQADFGGDGFAPGLAGPEFASAWKKQRKFPQGFIGRIQLEGSPQNIIRDLKSIVGKFPKQ